MSNDRQNAGDPVGVATGPVKVDDPVAPEDGQDPVEGGRGRDRHRSTVAILGIVAAAMTLLSAVLGFAGYNSRHEKVEAQAHASVLSEQVAELSVAVDVVQAERVSAEEQVEELRRQRDELQRQLDELLPGPNDATPNPGSPAPGVVYLASEEMVADYRYTEGSGQVRGAVYPNSVLTAPHTCQEAFVTHAEYDLALQYARLTATIGLSDKNEIFNRRAKFEIILDNELVYERTLTGGEATDIDIPVKDGLRLRLQTTFYESQDCNLRSDDDEAVWGDVAVHR